MQVLILAGSPDFSLIISAILTHSWNVTKEKIMRYCKLDIASQVVEIVVFYHYFETVLLSRLCYTDQLWCSDLSSNSGILFSV